MTTLAARIVAAREFAGLTQVELAKRVGLSQQAIAKIESGGNTRKTVEIATVCGVSSRWLATGQGDMRQSQPMSYLASTIDARRREKALSIAEVHARMRTFSWPAGLTPPDLETVKSWFDGTQRPLDVHYLRALYSALELDADAAISTAPAEPRTAVSHLYLSLFETLSADEQAAMLAALKARTGHRSE